MTKPEIISEIAERAGISKVDAESALQAFIDLVTESLAEGESVQLVGFGTWEARRREARTGRNPQTGEQLRIRARTVPAFKPGKTLKEAVSGQEGGEGGRQGSRSQGMGRGQRGQGGGEEEGGGRGQGGRGQRGGR